MRRLFGGVPCRGLAVMRRPFLVVRFQYDRGHILFSTLLTYLVGVRPDPGSAAPSCGLLFDFLGDDVKDLFLSGLEEVAEGAEAQSVEEGQDGQD